MNPFQDIAFVMAAHEGRQLPPDDGAELAFAGRSNAGKSSALNALVNRRSLARTSRTPGRTQQLVVFEVGEGNGTRLVDLPGYGYAKAPAALRRHWEKVIERYLRERRSLRGLVLIMDVRHPLKEVDRQLLGFCHAVDLPCLCLLTKADKLSRGKASATLEQVRQQIADEGWQAEAVLFSATKKTGVEPVRKALAARLGLAST